MRVLELIRGISVVINFRILIVGMFLHSNVEAAVCVHDIRGMAQRTCKFPCRSLNFGDLWGVGSFSVKIDLVPVMSPSGINFAKFLNTLVGFFSCKYG